MDLYHGIRLAVEYRRLREESASGNEVNGRPPNRKDCARAKALVRKGFPSGNVRVSTMMRREVGTRTGITGDGIQKIRTCHAPQTANVVVSEDSDRRRFSPTVRLIFRINDDIHGLDVSCVNFRPRKIR